MRLGLTIALLWGGCGASGAVEQTTAEGLGPDEPGAARTCVREDGAEMALGAATFTFDSEGRVLRIEEEGEAGRTTRRFEYADGVASRMVETEEGSGRSPHEVAYEQTGGSGSITVLRTGPENTAPRRTRVVYHLDADGRRALTEWDMNADGEVDARVRCTYDDAGRVVRVARQSGETELVTDWTYAGAGPIPTAVRRTRAGEVQRLRIGEAAPGELVVERLFDEGVSDEVHSSTRYRPFCVETVMPDCTPYSTPAWP